MAYQGLSLGDIVAQAGAIKGQQQRSQLADIQLQQAQTDQGQTQAINNLLSSNPTASLSDFVKAGGLKGAQASNEVTTARTNDSAAQALQQYHGLQQLQSAVTAAAQNPQAASQLLPQVRQYLPLIGMDPNTDFSHYTPQNWQQAASVISPHIQQIQSSLIDPKSQAEMQNARDIATGNNQTSLAVGAGNNQTSRLNNADNIRKDYEVEGRKAAVTQRGQDMEAARAGVPSGYERDPANPASLRPIAGGPHDPNAISSGLDSRSSVQFQRVVNAGNSAVESIKNISELPAGTNAGFFSGLTGQGQPSSLFGAGKAVLGRELTSQASQSYQTMLAGVSRNLATLETSGLAPAGSLTHSMDALAMQPGDTGVTQLRKMAEMRQIVVTNLEPQLSNPKLAAPQRQIIQNIVGAVQKAVPFTHSDITKLENSKNPQATIMDFAKQSGLPTAQPDSAPTGAAGPIKITGDADFAKLPSGAHFIGPDGQLRQKP
jgi:hypothetical protein